MPHCPKCQGSMTEGVTVDNSQGMLSVSQWVEGKPAKSVWVGLKLDGRKPVETTTFRCNRCGFLESYAPV